MHTVVVVVAGVGEVIPTGVIMVLDVLWVNGNWSCPSYIGMPYTMQASAPAAPAKDPDPSPNLAGATFS